MITVEIRKQKGSYRSFLCQGHAGYAQEGYDIICAAVSALTVNAINSIEAFTEDPYTGDAADGRIQWEFTEVPISAESNLIMDSLVMGLENIQESYGKKYIKIIKKA